MRFNLEIRNIQNSKRIILPLFSRQARSFGRIEAIIDTGSPRTILSAGDALRLNIPFTNFESSTPLAGLGKGKTPVLLINKKSQSQQAVGYSLSLQLETTRKDHSKLWGIKPNWSNKFTFSLRDSEEKTNNFTMPLLVADVPRIKKEGQDKLNNAARIPTLIGMDFLELNSFDLFVSLNKNYAYLEKSE